MTNKQIEETNIKIAKKLGWKSFRKERTPEPMNTRRMTGIAPGNVRHQYVPNYMFNLAYAMKLVDWANEHGYLFTLIKLANEPYEAMFKNYRTFFFNFGDIPSIAICNAFLRVPCCIKPLTSK